MNCFNEQGVQIATLVKMVEDSETLFDPNRPKVIINTKNEAIYFSRSVIPYIRKSDHQDWLKHHQFFQHIGLYAFRKDVLSTITKLPMSSLEIAESLEQNRWIENGYKIKVAMTTHETYAIDTPEDIHRIRNLGLF
jgi:3-deoxy-manno-octulosonate cytidylyltransferase (CMP-KDO synthetase)